MRKNLQYYLNRYKMKFNQQRLFSNEELRSIIEESKVGFNNSETTFIQKMKRSKIMKIIGLVSVAALLSTFWLINPADDNSTAQSLNNYNNKNEITVNNAVYDGTAVDSHAIPDVNVLELTYGELEKFGVRKTDNGLEVMMEALYYPKALRHLYRMGYDTAVKNGIYREKRFVNDFLRNMDGENTEMIRYAGWDVTVPMKIWPVSVNTWIFEDGEFRTSTAMSPTSPLIESGSLVYKEKSAFVTELKKEDNLDAGKIKKLISNRNKYPLLKNLIPVYFKSKLDDLVQHTLIWFVPTSEFVNLLPEKYKAALISNNRIVEKITSAGKTESREESLTVKINNPKRYGWKEINVRENEDVYGTPFIQKEPDISIGSIKLSTDAIQNVYLKLRNDMQDYNPPSMGLLYNQSGETAFNSAMANSIAEAKKQKNDIAVGKLQLYSFIAKKAAHNIEGMKVLKLSNKELEKIGVKFNGTSYSLVRDEKWDLNSDQRKRGFPIKVDDPKKDRVIMEITQDYLSDYLTKFGYDTTIRQGYYRKIQTLSDYNMYSETQKHDGWDVTKYLKIAPVAISCRGERYKYSDKWEMYNHSIFTSLQTFDESPLLEGNDLIHKKYNWGNNTFSSEVNTLIPVRIFVGDNDQTDLSKYKFTDYTLWYVPTGEFLDALPKRYSVPLRRELGLIAKVENGEVEPEEACAEAGEKEVILGICQMASESIKDLVVFPNPATTKSINLKFKLTKRCRLRIGLYEMSGRFIGNLDSQTLPEGSVELGLDLTGLAVRQGVYMLTLSTESGERVVQRLIVQ